MRLVGDGAAVASCPMRRGGGVLPDAARRWRLAGGYSVICRRMYSALIGSDSQGCGGVKVSEMSSKM